MPGKPCSKPRPRPLLDGPTIPFGFINRPSVGFPWLSRPPTFTLQVSEQPGRKSVIA